MVLRALAARTTQYQFRELFCCVVLGQTARFELPSGSSNRFRALCKSLDLQVVFSMQSFALNYEVGGSTWSNTMSACDDSFPGGVRLAYVAKGQEIAQRLHDADDANDEHLTGILLGYPPCCVMEYLRWATTSSRSPDPLDRLRHSKAALMLHKQYSPLDPFHRYEGLGWYSHVPCSLQCQPTLEIAERRQATMAYYFPNLARGSALMPFTTRT